jgi:hypothetical protein
LEGDLEAIISSSNFFSCSLSCSLCNSLAFFASDSPTKLFPKGKLDRNCLNKLFFWEGLSEEIFESLSKIFLIVEFKSLVLPPFCREDFFFLGYDLRVFTFLEFFFLKNFGVISFLYGEIKI